jgi:hypothetical protein
MQRIIEFPRPKAPEKKAEFPRPSAKKISNIADWKRQVQSMNTHVDNWPFCAA